MKLGADAYNEIRIWFYRNARPLDLALWQYYFENGSQENVVDKLAFYQNEDGGFGSGVEPDCWNTESSPYATLAAINILGGIGLTESNHPMIQKILCYLESGTHCSEDGWFFVIPSNDNWPRAPWMSYDEELNKVQELGVTAALCAFILRFGDRQSKVCEKAFCFVDQILDRVGVVEDFGEMGAEGLGILAQSILECGLSSRFDCSVILKGQKDLVNRTIERDPEKWAEYTPRPSEFIWSPASPFYQGNEQIVEEELDYLIRTRIPGGVWNITWTWFRLEEQYSKEFAVSENWWKAVKAIEKINFLKNFDRLL